MNDFADKEVIAERIIDALVKIVAENKQLITVLLWLSFFLLIALILFLPTIFSKLFNKNNSIKVNKTVYCKNVPCNGDIDSAFWLLFNYSKVNRNKLKIGLMNAYLLKWYKNGYIDVKKSSALSSDNYIIDLKDGAWQKSISENQIYAFFKEVAGNSNTLEKNKLLNYCSIDKNVKNVDAMFVSMSYDIQRNLERYQLIKVVRPKFRLIPKDNQIILSDRLNMDYQNIFGFERFISSSSAEELMNLNADTWDEYLIFASLLGIDDKVKNLYNKFSHTSNSSNSIFDVNFKKILKYKANPLWALLFIAQHLVTFVVVMSLITSDYSDNLKPLMVISPFLVFAGTLFALLRNHYLSRKVKEMHEITYGKVMNVTSVSRTERTQTNTDTGGYVNFVTYTDYYCTYVYQAGNNTFSGNSECSRYVRKNKKIKIYYNRMRPYESDTAYHYNFSLRLFIVLCVVFAIVGIICLKLFS